MKKLFNYQRPILWLILTIIWSCRSNELLRYEPLQAESELPVETPLWQGWQENELAKYLNIQKYFSPEDYDVSVRFFYKQMQPENSRAEITTPLLPNAILHARAALTEKDQEVSATTVHAEEKYQKDALFFFPLELLEATMTLDIPGLAGDKFEFRYQLSGSLALARLNEKTPFFSLLRLSELELGSLKSFRKLKSNAKQEKNPALETIPQIGAEAGQSTDINDTTSEEFHLIQQYLADMELFARQIFEHRIIAEKKMAPPTPLPLMKNQFTDALTVYFFPETLTVKQQNLLQESYRQILQTKYSINWAGSFSHNWSRTYSNDIFTDPHFRELRNSGKLWVQFQNHKSGLQALYNLRYASDIAIPKKHQLYKDNNQ